jgi:DNA-binding CsgD family transcriptional regulator
MAASALPVSRAAPPPLFEKSAVGWPGLASGVLDLLREAVLVSARDLQLLGSNRAARRLLSEGDGLATAQRSIVASTPAATNELRRGIELAARGEAHRMQVPRAGRAPLSLLVEPHPQAAVGGAAVIFATDPERGRAPAHTTLASRYGFTPAECDVARRLAEGADLERIAAELGITLYTVRGHLKAVFAKAGVHRQAELVARLLSEA